VWLQRELTKRTLCLHVDALSHPASDWPNTTGETISIDERINGTSLSTLRGADSARCHEVLHFAVAKPADITCNQKG